MGHESKEFMMLLKTKQRAVELAHKAANLIKRNVPAAISLGLSVIAIMLTVVCSAHTVTVFDGKTSYTTSGVASNIPAALAKVSLPNKEFNIVSITNHLFSTKVEITYRVPLTVKIGDKTTTYTVNQGKLADVLKQAGIEVDEHDIVSLSLDSFISGNETVEITDVEFAVETSVEAIPYGSDVIYSADYDTNTSFTEPGKAGSKTVTYSVKYVNGVAVSSTVVNETITEYAVDTTTVIGTSAPRYLATSYTKADNVASISKLDAPDDLLLDENGNPVNYSSKKTLRATAYTHTGNRMATGIYPTPGYVAVDPNEIPYGTKMYIVSADGRYVYGYAIAADTGGFIYGNRADMDLFMDTRGECVKFGRRDIVVYFVD